MANQCLDAVDRGDSSDGNRRKLRSGKADRLAVAEVEDDEFGREIDV